ncbi:MAG: serine/threonine-protein kinase [Candidatus Micrarchaeota archaeon]
MVGQGMKPPRSGDTIDPRAGEIRKGSILSPDRIRQAPVSQINDPLIGTHILQYKIVKRLGGGGMGTVYLAEDTSSKKEVAIKLMHSQLIIDTEARTRFFREANIVSKFRHPNIVDMLEVGEFQGKPFFAMEYLRGIDLSQHLFNVGALPFDQQLSILVQLCDGLSAIHAKGFIHRDIKLENIILLEMPDGSLRLKLIDFGLAKMFDLQIPPEGHLTRPGVCMGTPEYMAPEVTTGGKFDHRIDVYSVGVVMYFLFCNQFPFTSNSSGEQPLSIRIAMKHISDDLIPPSEVNLHIPKELSDLVVRAMEKNPKDRLDSVAEIRENIFAYAVSVGLRLDYVQEEGVHDTLQAPVVIVKNRIPRYVWWAATGAAVLIAAASRLVPSVHEKPEAPSIITPAPVELIPLVDLKQYSVKIQTKPGGASVHMIETANDGTRWQRALGETPFVNKLTGKHTIVLSLSGHLPIYIEVDANNSVFTDLSFQRVVPSNQ